MILNTNPFLCNFIGAPAIGAQSKTTVFMQQWECPHSSRKDKDNEMGTSSEKK